MSEKRPDWPHGYEGRIVCQRCAVEVRAVRLGTFRCDGCRRVGATRDGPRTVDRDRIFVALVAPERMWRTHSTRGVLRGAFPFDGRGFD